MLDLAAVIAHKITCRATVNTSKTNPFSSVCVCVHACMGLPSSNTLSHYTCCLKNNKLSKVHKFCMDQHLCKCVGNSDKFDENA